MVYAQVLLVIMPRFGIVHTIVLNTGKENNNTFCQMCKLLRLKVHTISGRNHDSILVERVNAYLNKGLTIFIQEQGTPAISREVVLLLIYACNSCSVLLTKISQAIDVTGRDFCFTIDFSHEKAVQLISNKNGTETYAKSRGRLLLHMRESVTLNIKELQSYQDERFSNILPDPLVSDIGDLVLARCSV